MLRPLAAGLVSALIAASLVLLFRPRPEAPVARPSRPAPSAAPKAPPRLAALAAENAELRAKLAARTGPAPVPAVAKRVDWAALRAAFDWKRLAELRRQPDTTSAETEELVRLFGESRKVALKRPTCDWELAALLLQIEAAGLTGSGPAVERAMADLDRLDAEPDPLRLANALKANELRRRLLAELSPMNPGDELVKSLGSGVNLPILIIDARDAEDAVAQLAERWRRGLDLAESAVPGLQRITKAYVDAWFADPVNREGFESGVMTGGGTSTESDEQLRSMLKMLNDVLATFPAEERLRDWLRGTDSIFAFRKVTR